jgi:hypothetical protein
MKKLILPGMLSAIVLLAACNKESSNSNTSSAIEGTYNFKYISAKTNSDITGSFGDKVITTSDYTTTSNAGTITFSNSMLTATGLTYTVDTEAKYYLYDGANLLDSSSFPFTFTLPASNSSGQYQLIGSDSIYFPQGGITAAIDGNGYYQSGASGGRYTLNGKLLTITQSFVKDSTFDDSGETYNMIESASASIVMEKQ